MNIPQGSMINGFSDLIRGQVITANGAFRINQRGTFSSWGTPAKTGDYACDLWKVGHNVDYVEVHNDYYGILGIRGHGKKGQTILFEQQPYVGGDLYWGHPFVGPSISTSSELTASALFRCDIGILKPLIYTRYAGAYSSLYSYLPVLKSGSKIDVVKGVRVVRTQFHVINNGCYCGFELMADGDFEGYISQFGELVGAFRNPPNTQVIPYADDLTRCQKYYQDIYIPTRHARANQWSTAPDAYAYMPFQTQVVMAGTPSGIITYNTPVNNYAGGGSYVAATNPSVSLVSLNATGGVIEYSCNDTQAYDYGFVLDNTHIYLTVN